MSFKERMPKNPKSSILGKKLNRRDALSTAGKVAVSAIVAGVIAGVGGYYAGSAATPAKTVTETVTETRTATVTKTETVTVATSPTATVTTSPTTTMATTTPTKLKPVEMELMHFFAQAQGEALKAICKKFEEKFPGCKVKPVYVENEPFKTKIRVVLPTPEAPDIFTIWVGETYLGQFIEAGLVLDLTDVWKERGWEDRFLRMGREASGVTWKGKHFGVPIDGGFNIMFYNKEIFDKLNLDVPKTFAELEQICEELKAHGIPPISLGGKDKWPVDHWYAYLMYEIAGNQYFEKLVRFELSEDVRWDDDRMIEPLRILRRFAEKEYFFGGPQGVAAWDYSAQTGNFEAERTAMMMTGSWYFYWEKPKEFEEKVGVFRLPRITTETYPQKDMNLPWLIAPGGALHSLQISTEAEKRGKTEAAIEFLDFFSSKEMMKVYSEYMGFGIFPMNKELMMDPTIDLGRPGKYIREVIELTEQYGAAIWTNMRYHPEIDEMMLPGYLQVITGEKAPEQLMKEVQKKAEEILARRRS